MANQAKKRKGAIDLSDFDERMLIGSISDMPAKVSNDPADVPVPVPEQAPATGTAKEKDHEGPATTAKQTKGAAAAGRREEVQAAIPQPVLDKNTAQQEEKKAKTPKSWEYNRFLTPTSGSKKSNIYISEINHQKVKSLLSLLGRGVSITDYVENMFENHWEQYGAEIQKRIKETSLFK